MKIRFISDLHYTDPMYFSGDKAEAHAFYIRTVIEELFSQEADLYLSLGDLIHGGTRLEIDTIYGWIGQHPEAKTKFHHISGNHDLDVYDRSQWPVQYYKGNYFQSYDGFHILYLETARIQNKDNYGGYVSPLVLSWLSEKIVQTGDDPLLIFAHHPVKDRTRLSWRRMMYVDEACNLEAVLECKEGPAVYINAHNHCDSILRDQNWTYLQAACELEYPAIKNIHISRDHLHYYCQDIESPEMDLARTVFLSEVPAFRPFGTPARGTVLERELKLDFT